MHVVRAGVQVLLPKLALQLSCHLVRHSWCLWGRFRWVSAEKGNGLGHAKTRNFPPCSCEEPLHKSTLHFGRCQLTNVLWPTTQHHMHSAPPVPGRWAMPWRQPEARAQGFALTGDSSGLHHPPQAALHTSSLENHRTCSSFASSEGLKAQLSCGRGRGCFALLQCHPVL